MARDALDGTPIRELALSSVYGDELGAGFSDFWKKIQDVEPEERIKFEQGRDAKSGPTARSSTGNPPRIKYQRHSPFDRPTAKPDH